MSSDKKQEDSKTYDEEDIKVEACPICCEMYSQTIRKKIKCNYCNYKSCASCFKKYCISTTNEPHCMSCKKKWSREFLASVLTKKFMNEDYKKHQEDLLLERELAMMPSTQYYLERKKVAKDYLDAADRIQDEINKLQSKHEEYLLCYNRNMNIYNYPKSYRREASSEEKREVAFTKPCPKDGCRGFINNRWNCGVCASKICSECHEIKADEHKCDENVVQSVKLIKAETKSCPKCYTPISKIVGCDQMWCTICKTAFSWTTGKAINGPIHNPHYFEYLRTIGREDEEIMNRFGQNCNQEGINGIFRRLNAVYRRNLPMDRQSNFTVLFNYIQHLFHLENVEIPRYNNNEDDEIQNVDLRIQYLENIIDRDTLKIKIQRRKKKVLFSQNILEIVQMYYDVSLDLIRELLLNIETEREVWDDFIQKARKLQNYTEESMEKIKTCYSYKNSNTQNITFKI
jgi:hypothetical protein